MARRFPHDTLKQLPHRHARRDRMRIHNNIGHYAILRKRHVLVIVHHSYRTFLSTATRKFVSNHRLPIHPQADLRKRIALAIHTLVIAIHVTLIVRLHAHARIARMDHAMHLVRHHLAHQNVIAIHIRIQRHKAIRAELAVIRRLQTRHRDRRVLIRLREDLLLARTVILCALIPIRLVIGTHIQPAIQRRLVHHHRVLLVKPGVRHDRHDRIHTRGQHIAVRVLRQPRAHNRLLGVVEHMCHRVHPFIEIRHIYTECLLAHG